MSEELPGLDPSSVLTPEEAAEDINPLHYAAAMGDKQSLQGILRMATADQVNMLDVYGRTALVYAVVSDKFTCAEMLIRKGISVDTPDGEGRTALHWACFHDKPKMVKLLLANGADTFIQDNDGRTCAHLACSAKSVKSFMAVVKARGADHDIDARDNWGMACIHWAAYGGSVDMLKHILLKLGGLFLLRDQEGKSPVHWAAGSGNLSCLQFLITFWNSGKNRHPDEVDVDMDVVNTVDLEGRAPLHIAVASGNEKVVNYLASLNTISIMQQDSLGRTSLHWAAHANHAKAATILLRRGGTRQFFTADANGASPLHYAANEGNVDVVDALLAFDDVHDVPDTYGRTALMVAAITGNIYIAQSIILSRKCDVLAKDHAGNTALHAAAYYGHHDIIAMLIHAGAPAHDPDFTDKTALFHATEAGHAECVRVLMENGADLSFRDEEGRSLLHWAAVSGHTDVVRVLLSSPEIDVDAKDTSLRTPLHNATFIGNAEIVGQLLDAGANVDAQDAMGIAPLHWAASRELVDVSKLLISRGATVNVSEYHEERLTPLDYANMTSNSELVKLLRKHNALTIEEIRDQAALQLQAWWKGHQARITLLSLFKKHLGVEESKAAIAPKKDFDGQRPVMKSRSSKKAKPLSPSAIVPKHDHLEPLRYSSTPSVTKEPLPQKRSGVTLPEIKGASPSPSKASLPMPSSSSHHSTSSLSGATTTTSSTDRRARRRGKTKSNVVPLPSINRTPGMEAQPLSSVGNNNKSSPTGRRGSVSKLTSRKQQRAAHKPGIPSLPIRNETQAQVQRERSRVKDIRAKVMAARVIQRAFRRWLFHPERQVPSPVHSPQRPRVFEGTVGFSVDENDKRQQIAALTIQLAWRQYIGRRAEREARQTSLNQSLARQMARQRQQKAVYDSTVPVVQWKPTLAPIVRPLEFRSLPSPAVTSFTMALNTYTQPFADIQRHRLQRAEEMLRLRQEDAERRLMQTEERMRSVLSLTAQRPSTALLYPVIESDHEDAVAYEQFQHDLHQSQQQQQQQQQQHWLQEQQQEQLGRKERQVHKEEEVCHAVAVTAPKTVITSITQHGMHGLTVLRPPRRRGAVASPEKTPTEDQDIHRQTHARHTPDHRPEHQQRHTSSREETANRAQVVVAVNVTDGRSGDGAATRNPYMCDGAPDQDADVDEGQGVGEQQRPQSNGPLVREQAVPDVHRRCSCKQSGCARDERSRGQEAETPCVADEEDTSVRISEDSAATVAESGRRRKKKRSKKSKGDKSKKKGEKGPLKIGGRRTAVAAHPLVLPRPSPATTKKMTTDEALRQRGLQRQRLLGAGTFGDVFLVRTRDGAHRTDSPSYSDTSMSTASSPSVGPCINNSSVVAGGGGAGGVDGSMVFALKIMPKTADEAFLDAVREEALIGFQLNHPHIVRAFEMFETRHSICLLLEAGEAGDLYDAVHSGAFDCGYAGHTSQVLLQVLSGLEFLHRNKQLVHCDIKCENIVLTPTHKAKICDLGTCRRVGHVQTIVNGTPEYLSPELVEVFYTHPDLRQPYTITPAIDLWAFGVLCFFVLTHEKPWTFAHPDNDRFRDAIIECTHVHRPWATFDATLIRFFATLLVLDASKRPAHEDIRAMIKDDWANVCRHWRSIHAVTYV